ncbi:MAG TPA: phage major capsid protein, partial [Novosphingobium sp.]|nr:phage major capsid protein [Novosphingobium sp.]
MDTTAPVEALDASFDLVARQDAAEQALGALRSDVDEVKSRLEKVSRAAARPVLESAGAASPELKGFVDGYLRLGRETQLKSISGAVTADGGYAVPREIDALIAAQLKAISPIRAIAQVVPSAPIGAAAGV